MNYKNYIELITDFKKYRQEKLKWMNVFCVSFNTFKRYCSFNLGHNVHIFFCAFQLHRQLLSLYFMKTSTGLTGDGFLWQSVREFALHAPIAHMCELLCHVWSLGWSGQGVTDTSSLSFDIKKKKSPECGQELLCSPHTASLLIGQLAHLMGGALHTAKRRKEFNCAKVPWWRISKVSERFRCAFYRGADMGMA